MELPRDVVEAGKAPDTGIDRLLKDGLLAFLLKLNKFLPPMPPQVKGNEESVSRTQQIRFALIIPSIYSNRENIGLTSA